MSGTKQTCEKYDYRFEIRREMMNTKRELKLEEMALVTGGGNLLIKHYLQEQIDKRNKAAELTVGFRISSSSFWSSPKHQDSDVNKWNRLLRIFVRMCQSKKASIAGYVNFF